MGRAGDEASAPDAPGAVLVFIVDPVCVHRRALTAFLADDSRVRVVGAARPADGETLTAVRPDVFVVDVSTTEGLAAASTLVIDETAKVIAIGAHNNRVRRECADAGIHGCASIDDDVVGLVDQIMSVARGSAKVPPRATSGGATIDLRSERLKRLNLTSRELEILEFIDQGYTNKQIGLALRIQLSTVKNHVHSILEKLQVDRRGAAAARVRADAASRDDTRIQVH